MSRQRKISTGAFVGVLLLLPLSFGCHTLRLEGARVMSRQLWPMEGRDSGRSHSVVESLRLPLHLDWEYNAAAGFGPGGPLIVGDYVLVANRKGEVHAVEATRGKRRGIEEFGDSVEGTPVIDGQMLYVPVSWGRKTGIVAYDVTGGRRVWTFETSPVTSGLLVAGDRVIFADEESIVYALSTGGELLWTFALDSKASVKGAPVLIEERTVVVADDRGSVHGLGLRDGDAEWSVDLSEPVYASMASSAGQLFVPTTRGSLYALDGHTGRHIWQYRHPNPLVRISTPAVSGTNLVVGGSDGRLTSLDSGTGLEQWSWQADGAISAAPAIAGNTVFFGTMDAQAHGLDIRNGEAIWSWEVRGRIKSSPAIGRDAVYFVGEPRYLYRFSPGAEDDESA